MKNSEKSVLGSGCLAALACLSSTWAHAGTAEAPPGSQPAADASPPPADNNLGIDEIIVTAQRRKEPLQDVPIAVSAHTAVQLQATGVTNTLELAEITPGLTFTYTAGNTEVRIRGVGTTSFGPGIENPSAVYIDGVYIASTAGALFNLANIDRVEVLKGPQGTLFGRNATGGLVQIITPDPVFETQGMARLSYGNYQTGAGDVYLTGGLTDKIAADISVHYSGQGEGWGTNVNTGADVNRLDNDTIVRSKVLFQPTDAMKFVLAGDYSYSDGSSALTLQLKPGAANQGVFEQVFGPINHGGYYDETDAHNPYGKMQSYGTSLSGMFDLGATEFKSITAFRQSSFSEDFDLTRVPEDVLFFDGTGKWQQISQEFQLSSAAPGPLQWTLGTYYFYSNDGWNPYNVDFGPAGAPLLVAPAFSSALLNYDDGQKTNSIAGYAQATYEILPQTHLTLGGRYTSETRSLYGTQEFIGYAGANAVPLVSPGTPFGVGIPSSLHEDNFSYRVALDHKITSDILAYVSFNTGFKSGGYNLTVAGNPPFKSEDLRAWEVGLKTELFDRRVRMNLAAYSYEYQNIQVNNFVATSEYISNGAAAKMRGIDADFEARATEKLTFNAGVAYVHDRFTSYPDADYNYVVSGCNYSNPSPDRVCQASAAGNELPGTPTFTASFGPTFETPLGSGKLGMSGNYFHSSGFYGTTDNDPRIRQAPYNLVNASLYWEPKTGGPRITLYGRNLFDKQYALNYFISSGEVTYQAAPPRIYGISVEQKF